MSVSATIAVLPGDGIGDEVMAQAIRVLEHVAYQGGHSFAFRRGLIGGVAFEALGLHFPEETRELCADSDAVLFGSVGGPVAEQHLDKWRNCEANSILALRKTFRFNANYRPARVYPSLVSICPLKNELVKDGVDILIIRELLGDLYFGAHTEFMKGGVRCASDVAEYDERQIASIAHHAFKAAAKRKKHLVSVDKANVLACGKLWRSVVTEIGAEYAHVRLEHMLVDNCAMQLIRAPGSFDVILTPNMFGDILSDEAAVFPGSLGLTPSASLNDDGFGLYEPSGGSAPGIAGKGIANPIAQILSAAMMLRFSFDLQTEARAIESAVEKVLDAGFRTQEIATAGDLLVGTAKMTDEIIASIAL